MLRRSFLMTTSMHNCARKWNQKCLISRTGCEISSITTQAKLRWSSARGSRKCTQTCFVSTWLTNSTRSTCWYRRSASLLRSTAKLTTTEEAISIRSRVSKLRFCASLAIVTSAYKCDTTAKTFTQTRKSGCATGSRTKYTSFTD